jgi:hypothetical protein
MANAKTKIVPVNVFEGRVFPDPQDNRWRNLSGTEHATYSFEHQVFVKHTFNNNRFEVLVDSTVVVGGRDAQLYFQAIEGAYNEHKRRQKEEIRQKALNAGAATWAQATRARTEKPV